VSFRIGGRHALHDRLRRRAGADVAVRARRLDRGGIITVSAASATAAVWRQRRRLRQMPASGAGSRMFRRGADAAGGIGAGAMAPAAPINLSSSSAAAR